MPPLQRSIALFLTTLFILLQPCLAAQFTNSGWNLEIGKPFTFQWTTLSPAEPIRLELVSGPATAVNTQSVIAHDVRGGSYEWTPPAGLPAGEYAVKITEGTEMVNYSPMFTISNKPTTSSGTSWTTSLGPTTSPGTSWTTSPSSTTTPGKSPTGTLTNSSGPSLPAEISAPLPSAPPSNPFNMDYGAKIAVGVGASVGATAFISIAAFIFCRRGKMAGERRNRGGGDDPSNTGTPEAAAEAGGWHKPELGGQTLSELDTGRVPVEIDSRNVIAEVKGDDCELGETDHETGVVELERKSDEVTTHRAEMDDGMKVKDEVNFKYII